MTEQAPEKQSDEQGDDQAAPDTEAGRSPYPGHGEQAAGEEQAAQNAAEDPPA